MALHDVRDVEAHVRALLDARLGEWGARLDAELYDDALAYLITKCWDLSRRYRPAAATLTFSTYSRRILRARVVDWYRQTFHDARYVKVTQVSLNTLSAIDDEETSLLERHSGDRDELNRHAVRDDLEEVLTRVALDC